eukprot:gnl/TRDRNA2_/TRDRNA2_165063_c0_seq1.p1 gnl/TRDRNA2_/TRDRNA2_165063_c0~~gnl/TRDRNA2_/TRDRNA2_165063_c0_seq1.p1  ORF type:complete len:229 (-),score=7.16 gnl/TRDRNA2_/TRDRNA2_165063_c0_seq1:66-752(-)
MSCSDSADTALQTTILLLPEGTTKDTEWIETGAGGTHFFIPQGTTSSKDTERIKTGLVGTLVGTTVVTHESGGFPRSFEVGQVCLNQPTRHKYTPTGRTRRNSDAKELLVPSNSTIRTPQSAPARATTSSPTSIIMGSPANRSVHGPPCSASSWTMPIVGAALVNSYAANYIVQVPAILAERVLIIYTEVVEVVVESMQLINAQMLQVPNSPARRSIRVCGELTTGWR